MNKKHLVTMALSAMLMIGIGEPVRSENALYCSLNSPKMQCSQCFLVANPPKPNPTRFTPAFYFSCCNNNFQGCDGFDSRNSWTNQIIMGPSIFKTFTSMSECNKYRNSVGCDEICKVNPAVPGQFTCPSHK